MEDRPRKDRLIQTRVPQDLESTLKDEARKRRLSVSHLIRNVLEDTFSLVDNVVHEVDRVVTDSVEIAQTLKRDAQRLAATARCPTTHRARRERSDDEPREGEEPAQADAPEPLTAGPLADVYGFQELVLNRPVECANCDQPIARGTKAFLGMTDRPKPPRVWVCQRCLDILSARD